MKIPTGKGMWMWKGYNCPPVPQVIAKLQEANVKSIYLKCADGITTGYASYKNMQDAVKQFKDAGIQVYLWQYIYGGVRYSSALRSCYPWGASPAKEAETAKRCIDELKPDGFVIDAEIEFMYYNQSARASAYMDALGNQEIPVVLSSFRFPKTHQIPFPWTTFMNRCDAVMPQIYWQPGGVNVETTKSISQFKSIILSGGRTIPVIPTGRAYIGDGHPFPTEPEVKLFLQIVKNQELVGANFWAMDYIYLHKSGPGCWKAIREFEWVPGEIPDNPPVVPPTASVLYNAKSNTNGLAVYKNNGGARSVSYNRIIYATGTPVGVYQENATWARISTDATPENGEWVRKNYLTKV